MSTRLKGSVGRVGRRSGLVERSIRVDAAIYAGVAEIAQRQGSSIQSLMERAMLQILREDTAKQTEELLAPQLDQVIQDRHRRLEAGLRTMMARVAFEVLRSQYIWLNFMTEAGIPPGKVDGWREQGWQFAVKEFKHQPESGADEEE